MLSAKCYLTDKCYPTISSLPYHKETCIPAIHLNFLYTDHQIQMLKKRKCGIMWRLARYKRIISRIGRVIFTIQHNSKQ